MARSKIKDTHKTKKQLIDELTELRRRIAELEALVTERKRAEKKLLLYQRQLKNLVSELSSAEERVRRRIATELYGEIGQILALSKIKLGALQESLSSGSHRSSLEEIRTLIDQTIQDTRSLVFELSPPILYELGFESAVEWLAERIRDQRGIWCHVENDGQPKPLDDDIRIVLFQAVRELLVNVCKHAQASQVKVSLWRENGQIGVRIEDNGVGFDTSTIDPGSLSTRGFGLFHIRERLEMFRGQFHIESEPDHGTRVTLTAPLEQESEHT